VELAIIGVQNVHLPQDVLNVKMILVVVISILTQILILVNLIVKQDIIEIQ